MRVCKGHCGAGGHEINGLLCRTAMYQTESIVQTPSPAITGHHRPPDCTLHDVETARNEEERSIHISPVTRDHYNIAAATVYQRLDWINTMMSGVFERKIPTF